MQLRKYSCWAVFSAIFFIAGCAHKQSPAAINDLQNGPWAGRISLQIQSQPPQAFFAGFELKGRAEQGELTLINPLGNVLGIIQWTPSEAVLRSGNDTKRFPSVEALLEQTTGAPIPVSALFDWLQGRNTSLNGWTADLAQQAQGKISARRLQPAPEMELRLTLEQ